MVKELRMKPQITKLVNVTVSLLTAFICLLILSSCNDLILDDSRGDSRKLDYRLTEGDTVASLYLSSLGTALLDAGYRPVQITVLQKAAEAELLSQGLSTSTDPSEVLPVIAKAAELATSEPAAGIAGTADQLTAIQALIEGAIETLGDLALQGSQAVVPDSKAHKNHPFSAPLQPATTGSLTYSDILDPLTTAIIANLDEAGIPENEIADSLESVVHHLSVAVSRTAENRESMTSMMKTITTSAVGACEYAGIGQAEFNSTVDAILESTFSGMLQTGVSGSDVADMADDLTGAAISGLGRTTRKKAEYGNIIDSIITNVRGGMEAAGVPSEECDRVNERITQTARERRIDLIANNSNNLVDSTTPQNRSHEVLPHSFISVSFNDDMDGASINSNSFLVDGLKAGLSGDISYDSGTNTATFAPTRQLTSHTMFFVSLSEEIRLESGAAWGSSHQFSFSTASSILELGSYHGCLLSNNGRVRCWGDNGNGELGQENTAYIGDDETVVDLPAVSVGTDRSVSAISAGDTFTCAILDDATLKCWGKNDYGQLGLGDNVDRGDTVSSMGDNLPLVDLGDGRTARSVTTGSRFACVILDNEDVKCWGDGTYGRLGSGDELVHGDGAGEMGNNLVPIDLGTGRVPRQISAGRYHACALFRDGSVKCWGRNQYGQLGLGDMNNRGDGVGLMGDSLGTVDLGTGRTAVEIYTGNYHNCALLDNNTVKCWGYNNDGQLGQELNSSVRIGDEAGEMGDNLPAVNLGSGRTALELSIGASHTCARLDNHTVKCWGSKTNGRLGFPSDQDIGDNLDEMGDSLPAVDLGTNQAVLEIHSGSSYNCVRLYDDTIKCWGNNSFGQLGQGDKEARGDDEGEMGDNLPTVDIELD